MNTVQTLSGKTNGGYPSFMSSLMRQFSKPSGFLGKIVGKIMELRGSNIARNLWTIELLELQPSDKVLEIGFGPGIAMEAALKKLQSGCFVGIDHSEVMVEMAGKKNKSAVQSGKAKLLCLPVEELPEFPESFDKVYMSNVMQFWKDKEENLKKVRSAMQTGGKIAITHMPRNKNATNQDALKSANEMVSHLKKGGFKNTTINELNSKPVLTVCITAIK